MPRSPRGVRAVGGFSLALALALGPMGCTFVVAVDELRLPRCTSSAQCEPLNERQGIAADACQRFQCVPLVATDTCGARVCRLASVDADGDGDAPPRCGGGDCDDANPARNARASEVCDGADNDCDGLVDEAAGRTTGAPVTAPRAGATSLHVGAGVAQDLLVTYEGAAAGELAALTLDEGGQATAHATATYAYENDRGTAEGSTRPAATPGARVRGCNPYDGTPASCNAHAPAAALLDRPRRRGVYAWIDTGRCTEGTLRVASFAWPDGSGALEPDLVGPPALSTLAYGAGLDEASGRTPRDAPLPRCTVPRASLDAPVVSGLAPDEASSPQGLVAWVARTPATSTEGELFALGVWFAPKDVDVHRALPIVHGTDARDGGLSARPQSLGRVGGRARPALVSFAAQRAHLVASVGTAPDALQLHWVPAITPPEFDLTTPPLRERPTYGTPATPALAPVALPPVALPGLSRGAPFVLVRGPQNGEQTELGVAWIEGSDAPPGPVRFARVRFSPSSPTTPAQVLSQTEVLTGPYRRVALAYVPAGLVTPSFARSPGDPPPGALELGGWVVAASTEVSASARRVWSRDGLPLGEPEALPGATGAVGDVVLQTVVSSATSPSFARVHYGALASGALQTGALLCAPDGAAPPPTGCPDADAGP